MAAVLAALVVALALAPAARATFSIVAVDVTTGEVGSAGASCIGGVAKIRDTIEGIGAINTQAYYASFNQRNARTRLLAGDSPDEVVAWLRANDANGTPGIRQYGLVDLYYGGRAAAHTGQQCEDWKGHRVGPNYAIQGNILLSERVVDVMEAAFLATEGQPLSDRLMAALEAASFPAADRRCGVLPSLSAYIEVARIGDGATPYLFLNAGSSSTNPITLLRGRYDTWKAGQASRVDAHATKVTVRPPVRLADGRAFGYLVVVPRNRYGVRIGSGLTITASNTGGGTIGVFEEREPGVYGAPITSPTEAGLDSFFVTVDDGTGPVTIARGATCRYVPSPH
jgi:uncharacterized Ntn-hydrolase superfamily protein